MGFLKFPKSPLASRSVEERFMRAARDSKSQHSSPAFSARSIAIVTVLGFVLLLTLIISGIYIRRKFWRRNRSALKDAAAKEAQIDIRHRKQTHSDRKVFSWFSKLDGEGRDIEDVRYLLLSERRFSELRRNGDDVLAVPSRTVSRQSVMSGVSALSGQSWATGH